MTVVIDRRLSPHLDWALLGAIAVLSVTGLVMIYSATYDPTTGEVGPQLTRVRSALCSSASWPSASA